MTTVQFQKKDGGKPYPRNVNEWLEKGFSPEQAEHRVAQDVFGHDYKTDPGGRPIENGIGSSVNQTTQHRAAMQLAASARSAMHSKVGYSSALAGAFDPRAQAIIDDLKAKVEQLMQQQAAPARRLHRKKDSKGAPPKVAKKSAKGGD